MPEITSHFDFSVQKVLRKVTASVSAGKLFRFRPFSGMNLEIIFFSCNGP
jgi:hypothetical protein